MDTPGRAFHQRRLSVGSESTPRPAHCSPSSRLLGASPCTVSVSSDAGLWSVMHDEAAEKRDRRRSRLCDLQATHSPRSQAEYRYDLPHTVPGHRQSTGMSCHTQSPVTGRVQVCPATHSPRSQAEYRYDLPHTVPGDRQSTGMTCHTQSPVTGRVQV